MRMMRESGSFVARCRPSLIFLTREEQEKGAAMVGCASRRSASLFIAGGEPKRFLVFRGGGKNSGACASRE